jgi:hypothetical protein
MNKTRHPFESARKTAKANQIQRIHDSSRLAKLAGWKSRNRLYEEKQKLILDFCERYPEDVNCDSLRQLSNGKLTIKLTGNALGRIHLMLTTEQFQASFPFSGHLLRSA